MQINSLAYSSSVNVTTTGGDLGGTGGTVLPQFEVGDGPCIRPPNILISRPTVIGCEAKYELSKKRSQGGIFCSEFQVGGWVQITTVK